MVLWIFQFQKKSSRDQEQSHSEFWFENYFHFNKITGGFIERKDIELESLGNINLHSEHIKLNVKHLKKCLICPKLVSLKCWVFCQLWSHIGIFPSKFKAWNILIFARSFVIYFHSNNSTLIFRWNLKFNSSIFVHYYKLSPTFASFRLSVRRTFKLHI